MAKKTRLDSKGKPLPDGVYEIRTKPGEYCVIYDGPRHPDGRRNPITDYADKETGERWKSAKKASQYRATQIKQIKDGGYISPAKVSLREYLEDWLEDKLLYVKAASVRTYRNQLKMFMNSPLGSTPLSKLQPLPVRKLLLQRIQEGLSPASAKDYLASLRSALSDAVNDKILAENPVVNVKLPEASREEVSILSPSEVNQFLDMVSEHKYSNLTIGFFYSGARRGELLGLSEKNCDFENNTVTFDQSVVEDDDNRPYIQDSLKTKSSKRTITLSPYAMQAIRRELLKRHRERLVAGSSYQDHGLVFANPDGTPLHPHHITLWYINQGIKFGRPDFKLHVTRHTHASLLIMAGEDIVTVSKRLGHSNVSMTMNVYGHLYKEKEQAAAKKFDSVIDRGAI